jgi:nicotinate phosphoribosyltransferase
MADTITELGDLRLADEELNYLKTDCPHLTPEYLSYMKTFRLRPSEQVELSFIPETNEYGSSDLGHLDLQIKGLWVETTLYEIPLLAIISEAYFRFRDTDWSYDGQLDAARKKGMQLADGKCSFSEFGSRRRRDYRTQETVLEGLKGIAGFSGTSNVHFAMKLNLNPIGTVAHEWFMGIAAITDDYENANELALRYWVQTFGPGVRLLIEVSWQSELIRNRSWASPLPIPLVLVAFSKLSRNKYRTIPRNGLLPKSFPECDRILVIH